MDKFQQIEAYLNNEMSEQEVSAFEQEMQQNTQLQEEVLLHQETNALLLDKFLLDEKKFMQNFDYKSNVVKPNFFKKYFLWLLFTGIIGIIFFINYTLHTNSKKNEVIILDTLTHSNLVLQHKEETPKKILVNQDIISLESSKNKQSTNVIDKSVPEGTQPVSSNQLFTKKEDSVFMMSPIKKDTLPIVGTKKNNEPKIISEPVIDPCENIRLSPKIKITPSCKEVSNGTIQISYNEKIFVNFNETGFSEQLNYHNLSEGNYSLEFKDENGCIQNKNITISEKICIDKPIYSFSKGIDGGFEFSLLDNEIPYNLKLISKKGKIIVDQTIEETIWWNCPEDIALGYYIILITFNDKQETIKGSLTILP